MASRCMDCKSVLCVSLDLMIKDTVFYLSVGRLRRIIIKNEPTCDCGGDADEKSPDILPHGTAEYNTFLANLSTQSLPLRVGVQNLRLKETSVTDNHWSVREKVE